MGEAHTYAELECLLQKVKGDLRFSAVGRVVAEVITVAGGEPRLSIGAHQLSEEHSLKLAAWIQRVFQRDGVDQSG